MMKAHDLDIRRLRLTAICTVCNRAFLKEVNDMNALIQDIGLPEFQTAASFCKARYPMGRFECNPTKKSNLIP